MEVKFTNIALIGKRHPSSVALSQTTFEKISSFLVQHGCNLCIESETAKYLQQNSYPILNLREIGEQCDLAIVIGGDGTMLGISCILAQYNIPLIGINHGRIGFITDIPLGAYDELLIPILQGQYYADKRPLLDIQILRYGCPLHQEAAINDLVLNRSSFEGMLEVAININQQFVTYTRADGLIVATATGSTAYSLSAGGPLLHPDVGGLVISPIAPHILSNRPIVVSKEAKIELEIITGKNVTASFDSRSFPNLQPNDIVTIGSSSMVATFLHPKDWNYFEILRKKLGWNEKHYLA